MPSAPIADVGAVRRQFAHHTYNARIGILFIGGMADADVVDCARNPDGLAYARTLAFLGAATNRSWISARAAEEAYSRGLIDERDLDRICD